MTREYFDYYGEGWVEHRDGQIYIRLSHPEDAEYLKDGNCVHVGALIYARYAAYVLGDVDHLAKLNGEE